MINNDGELQKITGTLTSREHRAIQMKYMGKTSCEIAEATGYDPGTIRNLFARGGRLRQALEKFVLSQSASEKAVTELLIQRTREEAPAALDRMITISEKLEDNPHVYKANEFLLSVVGIPPKADETIPTQINVLINVVRDEKDSKPQADASCNP